MPTALITTLSAAPAAAFPALVVIVLPTAFLDPLPEALARAMAALARSSTRAPMALITTLLGNALKRRDAAGAPACLAGPPSGLSERASLRGGFLPGGPKD